MTFKQILISVIVLLAAMYVYSYITDSTVRSETKNVFSEVKSGVSSRVNQIEPIKKQQHLSHSVCLADVGERIGYLKKRSSSTLRVNIIESKQFNQTEDVISYLEKWGFMGDSIIRDSIMPYPYLYEERNYFMIDTPTISEHDDLTVVMMKMENTIEGTNVAVTTPLLCLNGQLTENSAKNFQVSIF